MELLHIAHTYEVIVLKPGSWAWCESSKKLYFITIFNKILRSNNNFSSYDAAKDFVSLLLYLLDNEEFKLNFKEIVRKELINSERSKRKKKYKKYKKVLFENQNGICTICNEQMLFGTQHNKLPRNYATIDHIIPVSKGGSFGEDNLQLLCYKCNIRKDPN